MERTDRVLEAVDAEADEYETHEKITMDVEIPRQPLPEPSDGEVRQLAKTTRCSRADAV